MIVDMKVNAMDLKIGILVQTGKRCVKLTQSQPCFPA